MTKNNLSNAAWKLRATGALVLALALSTFPAAFSRVVKAQTPAKATVQTPAKAATSPASESKGGQKEGIKVHGHWTIDVRNPDGKLVTHREFENALLSGGAAALSSFLVREDTVGEWSIGIGAAIGGPCLFHDFSNPCWLLETDSTSSLGDPTYFRTLTLTKETGATSFVLSGTATAQRATQISYLTTVVQMKSFGNRRFTSVALTEPVNGICPPGAQCRVSVVSGQIIQVTVVISFPFSGD